ncbi:hypothetical protein F5Y03DRAFT_366584 [Xylaria venustula]|nr:hypothetical protein F5Y03DRAFT_366584 [Xylaria venustula]
MLKLLAIPALLAGGAQAYFEWIYDYNYESFHTAGDNFTISWDTLGRTDTFKLELATYLVTPVSGPLSADYKFESIVLNDNLNYADGSYTWTVDVQDGRVGDKWFYNFIAIDNRDYEPTYAREIFVQESS